jgi:hypothetical protein
VKSRDVASRFNHRREKLLLFQRLKFKKIACWIPKTPAKQQNHTILLSIYSFDDKFYGSANHGIETMVYAT